MYTGEGSWECSTLVYQPRLCLHSTAAVHSQPLRRVCCPNPRVPLRSAPSTLAAAPQACCSSCGVTQTCWPWSWATRRRTRSHATTQVTAGLRECSRPGRHCHCHCGSWQCLLPPVAHSPSPFPSLSLSLSLPRREDGFWFSHQHWCPDAAGGAGRGARRGAAAAAHARAGDGANATRLSQV